MKKLFFSAMFLFVYPVAFAQENEDCQMCHGKDGAAKQKINFDKFKKSIHGKNLCTSCHSSIKELPHEEKLAPVSCGQCHRLETEVYLGSTHGKAVAKGIKEAASCEACHGAPHTLLNSRNSSSPVNRLNIPKTCANCHEDTEKMKQYVLSQKHPFKSYQESVHGVMLLEKKNTSAASCSDCHGTHDLHAPIDSKSKLFKINVPDTCGKCHENVKQIYSMSIHGQAVKSGIKDAPACIDCHGEHIILSPRDPKSSVYTGTVVKTCAHCHASERIDTKYGLPSDRIKTYFESYHGLAAQAGSITVANCASCHGFHDILPSSDPRSSVHPTNIQKVCSKCHPGAGTQLAKGSVHLRPTQEKDKIIYYVRIFYICLIVFTIGGMLAHNLIDFAKKLKEHLKIIKKEKGVLKLPVNFRIQHIILLSSFFILVYTGFAHKFPKSWWAFPFNILSDGNKIRSIIHRIAGFILIALSLYHLIWFIVTKNGRKFFGALLPKIRDLIDPFKLIGYNLGLVQNKPKFEEFNYIEKSEYWALIWGTFIMAITGLLLMFENFTLARFPKWLADVALTIHFYEAILATLAIVVWHFYWVIFDPNVYPMNFTWLTGKHREPNQSEKK